MVSYEHKVKNIYLGGPEHILTYDFQYDGDLGFSRDTGSMYDRTYHGIENGQGLYRRSTSTSYSTNIMWKNSNIYNDKKLLSVKFNCYFGGNDFAVGLCTTNSGSEGLYTRYKEDPYGIVSRSNGIGITNHNTRYVTDKSVGNYTGEIEIVINFESGKEYGTINGDSFTLTSSYADQFVTARENHTLNIMLDVWQNTSTSYLRKVQFITE